jgi:dihydrodipicolinate synthase/N-acetylneuraminate lyase
MADERISGTVAAAVTPLRDGGARLDEQALEALLGFYRGSPLDGLFVLGTTGEGILFGGAERRRLAELAIAGAGQLKVVVHCGAQSTAETCTLAAHAADAGAGAVAVIGPPYFGFAAVELIEHFTSAASACAPLPFYMYEYADRTGYAVPVSVVEAVRERASNLVGLKVSDAPFERVEPYLATGLDVLIGAEQLLLEGLAAGAVGTVSGLAAAFPEAVCAVVRERSAEAAALVASLQAALTRHPFQAAAKAALAIRGVPVGGDVRAPLRALSGAQFELLRTDLGELASAEPLVAAPGRGD